MRLFSVIFFWLLALCNLYGQEGDYYILPTGRKVKEGQITLPNLKSEHIYWYFRPHGGLKLQGNHFGQHTGDRLVSTSSDELLWAITMGVNLNDKREFELGYMRNPQRLEWRTFDMTGRLLPYFFAVRNVEHRIQAQYKHRLFTVDRITRKTRINLMAGVQFSPWREEGQLQRINLTLTSPASRYSAADTLQIKSDFKQKRNLPTGMLGAELTGRVAEPLEIGLYFTCLFDPGGILSSDINLESTWAPPLKNSLNLNGLSALIGLSVRLNFHNGIKYTPENL